VKEKHEMVKGVQKDKKVRGLLSGARHRAVAAIVGGALLSIVALAPAAHAAETTTTFSLTAGLLSVSAPASAALSNAATGAASLSGSLGTVTVTDARGATLGWTASTTSSTFTGTGLSVIAAGDVSYAPGLATAFSGVVTPVPGLGGSMASSQTAFAGTVAVGNNSVSWAPGITVTLPSNALAGDYSGTITHSVI
jgi:hypothetical protein